MTAAAKVVQAARCAHLDTQHSAALCAWLRHVCANAAPHQPPLTWALARIVFEIANAMEMQRSVSTENRENDPGLLLSGRGWLSGVSGQAVFTRGRNGGQRTGRQRLWLRFSQGHGLARKLPAASVIIQCLANRQYNSWHAMRCAHSRFIGRAARLNALKPFALHTRTHGFAAGRLAGRSVERYL